MIRVHPRSFAAGSYFAVTPKSKLMRMPRIDGS
jgi:hypothetical protein